MGILVTFAGAWIWNILGAMDGIEDMPGLSGVLMAAGAVIGIVIVIFAVLSLVFGIMCFKRKGDPNCSTFPLVIGIIFTLFALDACVISLFTHHPYHDASPVPILVGAIFEQGSRRKSWFPMRDIRRNRTALSAAASAVSAALSAGA